MTDKEHGEKIPKAYGDREFLNGPNARGLRILAEYLEPQSRFERHQVRDTIVFMGSARTPSREAAEAAMSEAQAQGGDLAAAREGLGMSRYYENARELAKRLTIWSKALDGKAKRFVVCTGGGPGIMEAANRGASEARGLNVGLAISIPVEQFDNAYVSRQLAFNFHYFFMRKYWFAYLAKAVIVFPGGFGTLDELFELLTLVQTEKIRKRMPIVLFGKEYWNEVVNFDALVRHGTVAAKDLELVHRTDSVDETYRFITEELSVHAMSRPGPTL